MLVIRREQIRVFAIERQHQFHRKAAARWHTRTSKPHAEADVLGLVERSVKRASEQYGIDREGFLLRYLDFVQDLGEDFDRQPWAAEILSDRDLSTAQKLRLLEDAASAR